MSRRRNLWLQPTATLLFLLSGTALGAPAPLTVADGVRQAMGTLVAAPGEASLLALARREQLGWTATQNLFQERLDDLTNGFLEWRGHQAASGTFTTVRAGLYSGGPGAGLMVLNREWCRWDRCEDRTVFGRPGPGGWQPVAEAAVIPRLRDSDFYPGTVPACLRGVVLRVKYLPARFGAALTVLGLPPLADRDRCRASGVDPAVVLRPVVLHWNTAAGKFRRAP
ncbi:hypothetical protein [Deinococcus navajonensis]|uniref:Uncharacterized protein n=1 Tax=Deinococcus navajonensis TaxID=309884 RepID=A0ABV8XLS2_9DEIO